MAPFRTHNPNAIGPVLPSDKTRKANVTAATKNSLTNSSSTDDALLSIDALIQQFEHISQATTINENLPTTLRISKRLADLHDSSYKANDTIGGKTLPLSATKKDSSSSGLLPSSPLWVSDGRNQQQGQVRFPSTSRALSTGDVTNDQLPSFRIRDPPPMNRTTKGGSSSFQMETLRPKSRKVVSIGQPTKPVVQSHRAPMKYSAAASQYLPPVNQKPPYMSYVVLETLDGPPKDSAPTDTKTVKEYTHIIRGLTSRNTRTAAAEAEQVLRSMLITKVGPAAVQKSKADGACYNAVIHAYASLGMADKAEEILFLMFEDWQRGNMTAQPDVRIFTSVLKAWQRAKTQEAPDRCEKVIEAMNELSGYPRLENCKPDSYAMTALMHCWIDSKRKGIAAKVEGFFQDMKKKYQAGDQGMQPDCITYSIVMNAYVSERAYKKAEAILWEMVDDYLGGNELAEPRVRNFNTILAMYARSGQVQAPIRAEAIVAKFRELSIKEKLSIKPDAYTYSQLLKSWVKSGRKDGIDKAVSCFFWMKELGEAGDKAAAPDLVMYSTIICGYTGIGDYQQARSFLEVMAADYLRGNTKALPDVALYDHLIDACLFCANKKRPDSLKSADAIISELWCLSDSIPNLRPTMKMYSGLIYKYVELKNPQRAHALLMELLVTHHRVIGNPSVQLCRAVISAWEMSNHPSKKSFMFRIRVAMFELKE